MFSHVLDRMVTPSVVAKGRSSSRLISRTLRRLASLLLCGDLYPVALQTISMWNFSDSESRYVCSHCPPNAAPAYAPLSVLSRLLIRGSLGVSANTTKLYKSAVHECYIRRMKQGMFRCSSYTVLDRQLSEYFNHLYIAGMPM